MVKVGVEFEQLVATHGTPQSSMEGARLESTFESRDMIDDSSSSVSSGRGMHRSTIQSLSILSRSRGFSSRESAGSCRVAVSIDELGVYMGARAGVAIAVRYEGGGWSSRSRLVVRVEEMPRRVPPSRIGGIDASSYCFCFFSSTGSRSKDGRKNEGNSSEGRKKLGRSNEG